METRTVNSVRSHRDEWLSLLQDQGVRRPKALRVMEVLGGVVQATTGEPPGKISLEGAPGSVLMFNVSPVQRLRQVREGRSFVCDMLYGEMTLMARGVPSQWSWNTSCDRLDVIVSPHVFGDGSILDVVDQFVFRDPKMQAVCRRLYMELGFGRMAEGLYIESQLTKLAVLLLQRHSTASRRSRILPSSGLTRVQVRRVLEYIESNLGRHLTLSELARTIDLSLHHFARMFKRTMGAAPHQYVLERRVERAKSMMRATNVSLVEISLVTGFSSQSHFTSTFHRMVGATPTEFQVFQRKRIQSQQRYP